MTHPHLKGRRFINLVRCSSAEQADTSIPDQLKLLNAFAEQNGMLHVDDMILDGVTGSIPGARKDIDQLIRRKRDKDDFDALLVQDISRFTRSGGEHGAMLEWELSCAGIEPIFVSDNLPEGDHGGIVKSVMYYAAKQYAKSLSFAVSRGVQSSIAQGRIPHVQRVPYGIDRLYVSARDGRPLHILRNMTDGSQQRLDPQTKEVLSVYEKNEPKGKSKHYRKQVDERIELIPGAAEQVAAVRQIFRRRFIDGWGAFRIALELYDMGVPSPTGGSWNNASVKGIWSNPIYTGIGIANRISRAIYNMRSPNSPTAVRADRQTLAKRKRLPYRARPKTEWMRIEHPHLADYLDPEVKELARAEHQKEMERKAQGRSSAVSKDRHLDSAYLLKGILRAKQGGHLMTGRTSGPGKYRRRYYHVSRARSVPQRGSELAPFVPADAIEDAAINLLSMTLKYANALRDRTRRLVEQHLDRAHKDWDEMDALNAERDAIREQIEFAISNVGRLGKQIAKQKLDQLEAQLDVLDQRRVKAAAAAGGHEVDVDAAVEKIMSRLRQFGRQIGGSSPESVRRLLRILVHRLEVDLQTRAFEIEIALPLWAAFDESKLKNALRLDDSSIYGTRNEAKADSAILLAAFSCSAASSKGCFACRRTAA